MRTKFTGEDVKNIIDHIFNGNMELSNASNGSITYKNENSENIILIDEETGTQTKEDLAKYLNIHFYNWKDRVVEKGTGFIEETIDYSTFDTWVQSLNFSMNEAYALVEKIDEEVVASQDIDSSTIIGKITFLIQSNKIKNLDDYVTKIRNNYLGVPQEIQNSYGDIIKTFILIGALSYEQEPSTIQIGECLVVSCNFKISYLGDALCYTDTKIEISLDGDDEYDVNGDIVGKTKYLEMPITKMTWQNIFSSNAVPTAVRPDLTGYIATALQTAKTISFYDFNKTLTMRFNEVFWSCSAYRINGKETVSRDVNIPVYIRITSNENVYVFKDVIYEMQKILTNTDFNVCSITTKGWGKLSQSLVQSSY